MPLYEYACRSCGAMFERRRKFDERLAAASCPGCGAEARVRLSVPGLVGAGSSTPDASCATMPPGACCGGGACGMN